MNPTWRPPDRAAWLLELRRENAEQEATLAGTFEEHWGEIGETHRAFVERFCSMLPAGGRVLDAACGTGKYFGMVLERGLQPLGVDHTGAYLDAARERFPLALQGRLRGPGRARGSVGRGLRVPPRPGSGHGGHAPGA